MPALTEHEVSAKGQAQDGPVSARRLHSESSQTLQHTTALSSNILLANTEAATAITDTYHPRHVSFRPLDSSLICDEKVIKHDHSVARHYESQSVTRPHSRNTIQHRDLGGLNLIANLTRIRYGYWHDDPACLISFKFQFLGSEPRWTRFEKAVISVHFSSLIAPTVETGQESSSSLVGVGLDPEVVDFGPKHLSSVGTTEARECHVSAQLAASLPLAPITITPSISAGFSRSYARHYASSVEAAAFPSHGHTSPDGVRFWIREDAKQKDGIPLEFDCAAIVIYAAPSSFQATVEIKVGPMFDMLAQPWGHAEPVIFQQGIELREPLASADNGLMDFATFREQDWSTLVGTQELIKAAAHNTAQEPPVVSGLRHVLQK